MTKNKHYCKKCENEIFTSDVACSNCGNILRQTPVIKKNNSLTITNKFICLFKTFLSFIFLILTLSVAYAYLFDFSQFLKITDYLFLNKQIELCNIVLYQYKILALSKDRPNIKKKYNQMILEKKHGTSNAKLNSIEINYLSHKITPNTNQFHLKCRIKNTAPFSFVFYNNQFYLKDNHNIYLSNNLTLKKIVIHPWKSKDFTISFNTLDFKNKNIFKGKLVFNNSKKYANCYDLYIKLNTGIN